LAFELQPQLVNSYRQNHKLSLTSISFSLKIISHTSGVIALNTGRSINVICD